MGGAAYELVHNPEYCDRFNAARGFVGGAAGALSEHDVSGTCFNAARGFVGGATI